MTFSGPPTDSPWTDARIEHLKACHAAGMTDSEMLRTAEFRTISRGSLIGKRCRLGLSANVATSKPARRAAALNPRQRRQPPGVAKVQLYDGWRKPRQSRQGGSGVAIQPAAIPLAPEPAEPTPATAVTIMGLTATTCRWPLGEPRHDMLYCGAAKDEGVAYCGWHCGWAFKPRSSHAA
jgi:GcrA cell cycle regulator